MRAARRSTQEKEEEEKSTEVSLHLFDVLLPAEPSCPHLVRTLLSDNRAEVKPPLKVREVAEDIGHDEVEQRPKLGQVVLMEDGGHRGLEMP